jgi:hypothetical protein
MATAAARLPTIAAPATFRSTFGRIDTRTEAEATLPRSTL